jgi:hypothetical protein
MRPMSLWTPLVTKRENGVIGNDGASRLPRQRGVFHRDVGTGKERTDQMRAFTHILE